MDLLDAIILIIVAVYATRGFTTGFFRQAGSLGGFILGLWFGSMLATLTVQWVSGPDAKAATALLTVLGVAVFMGSAGEFAGLSLAGVAARLRVVVLDKTIGAVLGAMIALIMVWVLGSIFSRAPFPSLTAQMQNSAILQGLNRGLPPVPDVIVGVEHLVAPNGFPRAFAGLEPQPAAPVTGPDAAAIEQAAAAGRAATVKIDGAGCGGVVEGSGFVVAPGLVATNAHVVAGIARPTVIDRQGTHSASVVQFDPDLDFAVLRTTGLAGSPLPLSEGDYPRGTVGAVLGYPGGGNFTISSAAVLDEQSAVGRNIYDRGLVRRNIYELQAVVRPGNSGGPMITPQGVVIGVVFAASTTNSDIGYALSSSEVRDEVAAASTSGPVSSGACAAE